MKYLIYTRVSPKGSNWVGSETTVVDQAAQCKAYIFATDPQGEVLDTVTDEFESGCSSKRPGWQTILSDLEHDRSEWDVLVVRHLDRFSRSLTDALQALEIIHEKGKYLIATAQGINSSTPSGRGVINILLSIAQMEREFTAERTKLKMTSIAAKGEWPVGKPPYGYKRGRKHDNKLYTDKEKAQHVQNIYRRYQDGCRALELARDYGIPRSTVYKILTNRVYLGLICYAGKEYRGQHEAIITPQQWDDVQSTRPGHGHAPRPESQKYPYVLSGLVKCECGFCMTPSSSHGRGGRRYHYYRCTDLKVCRGRARAHDVENAVLAALSEIRLTDEDVEGVAEEIRALMTKHSPDKSRLEKLRTDLFNAQQRRDNIIETFASGMISAENAARINQELAKASDRCNDLAGQVKAMETLLVAADPAVDEMIRFTRSLNTIGEILVSAQKTPEELRQFITTWVKEVRRTGEGWDVILNLPGSPNVREWLPFVKPDEPFLLARCGGVTVSLAAA